MSHKYFWLILMTLLLGLQTILVFAQQEMPEEDFQLQGILIFLFIYVLISLGLTALCLLVNIYFARFFSRITEYSASASGRSFWLGLGNGVSIFVLLVLLGNFEGNPVQILIIPLLLVGGIGILIGLSAEAQLIGQWVMKYRSREEPSPVSVTVAGIVVIAFGSLVPIVGQLALLLIVLKGFGAAIGAVFRRA